MATKKESKDSQRTTCQMHGHIYCDDKNCCNGICSDCGKTRDQN